MTSLKKSGFKELEEKSIELKLLQKLVDQAKKICMSRDH
jgi:hypothetical protein